MAAVGDLFDLLSLLVDLMLVIGRRRPGSCGHLHLPCSGGKGLPRSDPGTSALSAQHV